jgi:hypothetical protein
MGPRRGMRKAKPFRAGIARITDLEIGYAGLDKPV